MSIKQDIFNEYNKEKYKENTHWKVKDIAKIYKYENSDWNWDKCYNKAKQIRKEIKKINGREFRNNATFFKMNTPFSFYDNKDGEFSDIPWDGKWE